MDEIKKQEDVKSHPLISIKSRALKPAFENLILKQPEQHR